MSDTPLTGPGEPKRLPDDAPLSEPELQRVIERATQLDAVRGGEITVAELKRVAAELNISSTALSQALDELAAQPSPTDAPVPTVERAPDTTPRSGSWWRPLGIGIASFLFGSYNVGRTLGANAEPANLNFSTHA